MCSVGYCHAFLLSTAGVDGLELSFQQESMTMPKAAHKVLQVPDDGRKNRPKHVEC
jgi:hypothetical protein